MKKIVLLLGMLICCSCTVTYVPFEPQKKTVNINNPSVAFETAIECASRAVRPPSTGQMFTYQSEKYNKFIMSFLMDAWSDFLYGTAVNVDGVMRYSTSQDGKEGIVEITDMRLCSGYSGCQNAVPKENMYKYKNASERVIKEVTQCILDNPH